MCFEPTYEELKPQLETKWGPIWGSFEPTYEELKLMLNFHLVIKVSVLSLPMRNWNLCYPNTTQHCWSGFEPTYEELKQVASLLASISCLCFEPTYEELKLTFGGWFALYLTGFEPTYEELKLLLI